MHNLKSPSFEYLRFDIDLKNSESDFFTNYFFFSSESDQVLRNGRFSPQTQILSLFPNICIMHELKIYFLLNTYNWDHIPLEGQAIIPERIATKASGLAEHVAKLNPHHIN